MTSIPVNRVVAYVPFTTFLSAIEGLERGIPPQIDTSVWPTYSVAIQSQLLGSFRFLSLIDNGGKPTAALKSLVQDKANRKVTLRRILESSYARIVSLDLTRISPRHFDEAIHEYGMSGETHKKVVSFFLRAARHAELPLSPLLERRIRGGRPRRRKRTDGHGSGRAHVAEAPLNALPPQSKTVILRSGGSVTLNLEGSFLEMTMDDRQFVSRLVDLLHEYGK